MPWTAGGIQRFWEYVHYTNFQCSSNMLWRKQRLHVYQTTVFLCVKLPAGPGKCVNGAGSDECMQRKVYSITFRLFKCLWLTFLRYKNCWIFLELAFSSIWHFNTTPTMHYSIPGNNQSILLFMVSLTEQTLGIQKLMHCGILFHLLYCKLLLNIFFLLHYYYVHWIFMRKSSIMMWWYF